MSETKQNKNERDYLKELKGFPSDKVKELESRVRSLRDGIGARIFDLVEKRNAVKRREAERELEEIHASEIQEAEVMEEVEAVAEIQEVKQEAIKPEETAALPEIKAEEIPAAEEPQKEEPVTEASEAPAAEEPKAEEEKKPELTPEELAAKQLQEDRKRKAQEAITRSINYDRRGGETFGFTSSKTFTYDDRGQRRTVGGTGIGRPGYNNQNGTSTGYQGGRTQNGAQGQRPPFGRKPGNVVPAADIVTKNQTFGKDAPKKKKPFEKDDKKQPLNKKSMIRKGYAPDTVMSIYADDESVRHVKVRRSKKEDFTPNTVNIENAVITSPDITIKTLSEKIGKTAAQIIKKLFDLGETRTINELISFELAELVASEFDITLEYKPVQSAEDKLQDIIVDNTDTATMVKRPPVVTIMGHVDHGKTSLLDYIRNTNVVSGEAGGITQHIGAYTIELNGAPITFLDTPGHEAFTSMRLRGAMITDIAIIVVAADDGIMPQTVEAINHAKKADVSIVVAINKMDKPGANPDKIKQQLAQYELIPEEWGGDVIVCPVSAKTGDGVKSLLENLLLLADVKELKANIECPAQGAVIEAKLDKGMGPVATILVQNGTLKVGDFVVAGTVTGKVRAMTDYLGNRVKEAGPSIAVSILGLSEVPGAGDQIFAVANEKLAKQIAEERRVKEQEERNRIHKRSLEDMFKHIGEGEKKTLNVIIKADVQGSAEAIRQAIEKLTEKMLERGLAVSIVHAQVGAVNESDVMLADTTSSVILCFNVRPEPKAKALAERSGIDIKSYRIIYDLTDDLEKALLGLLEPVFREEELGHAEVRDTFRITGVGTIAGCYVTDGKIMRNAKMRLIRDNIVIYEGSVSSLKRMKDDAKEVARGYECGIGLEGFNDIKVGDIIEAFLLVQEEVK